MATPSSITNNEQHNQQQFNNSVIKTNHNSSEHNHAHPDRDGAQDDEGVHRTRKRTNSVIKRPPRHDDYLVLQHNTPSPLSSHHHSLTSARATLPTSSALISNLHPQQQQQQQQQSEQEQSSKQKLNMISTHNDNQNSSTTVSLSLSLKTNSATTHNPTPSTSTSTIPNRHPRQMVPLDIGFPTNEIKHVIHKQDLDDRLLMATCAVLRDHHNRALCPKEIAEVMFERNWLHNAGTTPFAHISTCIRAHIRRASGDGGASAPYTPILVQFELAGALTAAEVRAVGLRPEERPAVKRGTLWYLNEAVFGKGVGAEDPFIRCRREAGLEPSEKNGLYVRTKLMYPLAQSYPLSGTTAATTSAALSGSAIVMDEDEDEPGMGRGKRKRRASSAAIAAATEMAFAGGAAPGGVAATVPRPPNGQFPIIAHRRANSFGGTSSSSSNGGMTFKSSVPRLRLRLTSLEEVDSSIDDSDGQTSDAQLRRKNKKKPRRAVSEGMSRSGSVESSDDEIVGTGGLASRTSVSSSTGSTPARPAFSSAASSALLAQSLLAASTCSSTSNASPSSNHLLSSPSPETEVVSPASLQFTGNGPFQPARPSSHHHLSMSAPNLFSAFPSATSPESMELDDDSNRSPTSAGGQLRSLLHNHSSLVDGDDSADEEDFHEAMLRSDDFDFEWGCESYANGGNSSSSATLSSSLPSSTFPFHKSSSKLQGGKARDSSDADGEQLDMSASLVFDDVDAASTPATTPRSPQPFEEEPTPPPPPVGFRKGMEATLCAAFAEESDRSVASQEETDPSEARGLARSHSNESLDSLDLDDSDAEDQQPLTLHRLESEVAVPLPSPLALELPTLLAASHPFASDFDFVGHEEDEDDHDLRRYRSYERDMAESADDEDEGADDEIVRVKIEDEEPHGLGLGGGVSGGGGSASGISSRQSSVFPLDSFSQQVRMTDHISSSSSSSGSSDTDFDPHVIVSSSKSLLASGLSIAQRDVMTTSPPADLSDWGMNLDLDDLDLDLHGVDFLGPETVALEELDLAWGGSPEPGDDEEYVARASKGDKATNSTFLTGPSGDAFSAALSQRERDERTRLLVAASSPVITPIVGTPPRADTPSTRAGGSKNSSQILVYPTTPLAPVVMATIIQLGVGVYGTNVVDSETHVQLSLYRRLDTDYVNGTVLLQSTFSDAKEREVILDGISDTFRVSTGGRGIEGVWVPLAAARRLVSQFPALGHLHTFLDDDLCSLFPEPIPSMRKNFREALATSSSSILGYPPLADAQIIGTSRSKSSSPVTASPGPSSLRRSRTSSSSLKPSSLDEQALSRKTRRRSVSTK
ncbi:hypothetical protein T439DRAFT_170310 [Meredithblackwellia eburnea MCA 4105]